MIEPLASLPTRRNLYLCWGVLMSMTCVSLLASDPNGEAGRLSLASITIVLLAASVKASQVMLVFLNLRSTTSTWRLGFITFLFVIIGLVWACAGIGVWLGR